MIKGSFVYYEEKREALTQWVRMRSFLWFNLAPHIHKYMGELAVHSSRNSAHFSVIHGESERSARPF